MVSALFFFCLLLSRLQSKPLYLPSQLEEAEEGAPGEGVVDRVVYAKVTLRTVQPLPSWGKSPIAVWSLWHGPFLPGDVGFGALLVFSPCLVVGP